MTINEMMIKELEHTFRRTFPANFKKYLLVKYAEEPFPHEFSEQDLYTNIQRDIHNYEDGKLDVKVKSSSERLHEEREYLQNMCIEKFHEVRDLEEYVAELEHMLSEHGLESSRMSERRRIQF